MMPLSSNAFNKEQLSAFERWELDSFDNHPAAQTAENQQHNTPPVAAAELEKIRQQAYEEGYASGLEAGNAASIQQAYDEASQIHQLLQNLQGELNKIDENISQSLLDLSLGVAQKMVSEILLVKPEVILKIVSAAINSLPHFNQNAHLIMHPDDAELVRKYMGEQLHHSGWKIFTDTKLLRGGCRVETTHTHVDATTEARWKRIVQMIGQDKSWRA